MPHCDLPPGATGAAYCGHCGLPLTERRHEACPRRLELEPPRYCRRCRRRMVVQVTPDRWIAQCVEHGETTALTWADAAAASGRPTR